MYILYDKGFPDTEGLSTLTPSNGFAASHTGCIVSLDGKVNFLEVPPLKVALSKIGNFTKNYRVVKILVSEVNEVFI